MKRLLLFLSLLLPFLVKAQTLPITLSYRTNTPVNALDSIAYTYTGITPAGYKWLYPAAYIRANYVKFADTALLFSNMVHKTGTETINGLKTATSLWTWSSGTNAHVVSPFFDNVIDNATNESVTVRATSIQYQKGAFATGLNFTVPTGSNSISFPNESGTVQLRVDTIGSGGFVTNSGLRDNTSTLYRKTLYTGTKITSVATYQTPAGTAGTDSIAVKIGSTGKMGAIGAGSYIQDLHSALTGTQATARIAISGGVNSDFGITESYLTLGDTLSTRATKIATHFGTSITAGFGPLNGYNAYAYAWDYRAGAITDNKGISGTTMVAAVGHTVNAMINRISEIPVYAWNRYVLSFEYGTNDAGLGIDTATFRANYKTVLDSAIIARHWPKNKIVIILPTYGNTSYGTNLPTFIRIAREVALQKGVTPIDTYTLLQNNGGGANLDYTGIHPNDRGSKLITQAILDSVVYKSTGNIHAFGNIRGMGNAIIDSTINANKFVGDGSLITNVPLSTITGIGTGVKTALAINIGSAGAPVLLNGAGGTPSSLTLTNATGLPVAGGGTGVSSASITALNNIIGSSYTSRTGTGNLVGSITPAFTGTPTFTSTGTAATFSTTAAAATPQITSFLAGSTVGSGAVGSGPYVPFGVAASGYNAGVFQYNYTSAGSVNNHISLGLFGISSPLDIYADAIALPLESASQLLGTDVNKKVKTITVLPAGVTAINWYTTSATPSVSAGAAAGTSPTITFSSGSTNQDGVISISTGTSPTTGILATITMSGGYTYPHSTTPVITPVGDNAISIQQNVGIGSISGGAWEIRTVSALTASTTYQFTYHNGGY